ncbi:pentapeptide repeat-containing protein [Nostoc sp. FACHB-133]|uniref:pentapeptide repeat-containing protein n=1 Tax=Nostoc sp. FACHB-133 TaxID=2692835 RepID=UPI001683C9A5|nr:pentapeptide repeat-containing protein [Nostoc sp. FACHB-133]MBD2523423.1 pentapeptide repeat-containing protein [Nostoc sp. FACHB-133]
MSNTSGFSVSKPVALWNKPIKADFKELFKSLGKGAINGVLGQWGEVAKDALEATTALGLSAAPEEVAWLLIYRSLVEAIVSLVKGNQELLFEKPNEGDLELLCDRLNDSLVSIELRIDQDFFSRPKDLPILEAIKTAFADWLKYFSVNQAQALTISHRLPTYFVYALHEEWAKHPEKYACLKEELDTPFTQANEREQSWQRYLAWLQKQVEEPMLLEAFGLKQVYVPLHAYYKQKVGGEKSEEFERRLREDEKYQRIVLDLEAELEAWLEKGDRNDAIRVISGGPGSGKSSFAKIFAANQAEKGKIPVLFIPLHHFEPSDDLVEAVGKFVRDDGFLRHNPLDKDKADSRLLIIFDGLDELAMQGKIATEIAQQFVREVQRKVERFNGRKTCLQVLISGRELVVQANSSDFRQPQQILHILPYFVHEYERTNYIDDQNLLQQDQRQIWWQKYGNASGRGYDCLPEELNQDNLTEITAQPLLNYLVALSFDQQKKFPTDGNLNAIYANLLTAVYQRGWAGYQHPAIRGIEEKDFVRILEEIALASWHGDGRTTTVREIEAHCEHSSLKSLLDKFQESAKLGVTRLLTAFYFRESGVKEQEKTFEFTHKSFGEYLTAKRIVREVRLIHKKLKDRQNDPDEGWDEREALKRWAILCGASAMDEYLFKFVADEMPLQNASDVSNWQQTLCHLIGFMLRHGMPMERLTPRPDFQEENRQARNAEEALLAVLNACARATKTVSKIQWHTPEAFGIWISRLQGQRIDPYTDVFCLNCLSFLDLEGCVLALKDFFGANLVEAYLVEAYLGWTNLTGADLIRANLVGAHLEWADLEQAHLVEANLEQAYLVGANFVDANLEGANFEGAYLVEANLVRAILKGANLKGANLEKANLEKANLEGANLEGANLVGANLEKAYLEGANLVGANLEWLRLKRTNFEVENLAYLLANLNEDSGSDSDE